MLKGFRDYLFRGNVVDLAVAVVIGGAFGSIVTSLVKDIVTPIIGAIGGQPDFSNIYFTVNNSKFMIGNFLNTVIAFVMIVGVIYFVVIVPMNKIMTAMKKEEKIDPTHNECPECLSKIPINAKRCMYCTSILKK
ncbi:large conductance mechanosensitive channel protein MscL [Candidatus Woesebacteria bacterium]|nr:large conductance mechanosensitive channel protein MscL [Candidatus Woesebacteria bacterium]